jgi:hypothetical protein
MTIPTRLTAGVTDRAKSTARTAASTASPVSVAKETGTIRTMGVQR